MAFDRRSPDWAVTTSAAVALGLLAAAPSPASAAAPAETKCQARSPGASLRNELVDPRQTEAAYHGRLQLDPRRDLWSPVTQAETHRANKNSPFEKPFYCLRVRVDYDRDGHVDVAELVNNSRQGAVLVTFGGPLRRAPLVIYKRDEWFASGEEIKADGQHRVELNQPEVGVVTLLMQGGRPRAMYTGH